MNSQRMNRSLPIVLLSIVLGFLFFLAPPCNAWKTKDPKLAEEYANMLGFKVKDRVGKVAPEIKPGIIIDGTNYKDYPGLKELLPESLYSRFDPGAYAPLAPIKNQPQRGWFWDNPWKGIICLCPLRRQRLSCLQSLN